MELPILQDVREIKNVSDIQDFDLTKEFEADIKPQIEAARSVLIDHRVPHILAVTTATGFLNNQLVNHREYMTGNICVVRDAAMCVGAEAISSPSSLDAGFRIMSRVLADPGMQYGALLALEQQGYRVSLPDGHPNKPH